MPTRPLGVSKSSYLDVFRLKLTSNPSLEAMLAGADEISPKKNPESHSYLPLEMDKDNSFLSPQGVT